MIWYQRKHKIYADEICRDIPFLKCGDGPAFFKCHQDHWDKDYSLYVFYGNQGHWIGRFKSSQDISDTCDNWIKTLKESL